MSTLLHQGLRLEMGAALAAGHADLEGREAAVKEAERRLTQQQVRCGKAKREEGFSSGMSFGTLCGDVAAVAHSSGCGTWQYACSHGAVVASRRQLRVLGACATLSMHCAATTVWTLPEPAPHALPVTFPRLSWQCCVLLPWTCSSVRHQWPHSSRR